MATVQDRAATAAAPAIMSAEELARLLIDYRIIPGKARTVKLKRASVISRLQQQGIISVEGTLLGPQMSHLDPSGRRVFVKRDGPYPPARAVKDLWLRLGTKAGRPHIMCCLPKTAPLLARVNAAIGSRMVATGLLRCTPRRATPQAPGQENVRLFEINPLIGLTLDGEPLALPDLAAVFSERLLPPVAAESLARSVAAMYDKDEDVLTIRLRQAVPDRVRITGTVQSIEDRIITLYTPDGFIEVLAVPGLVALENGEDENDRRLVITAVTSFDLAVAIARKPAVRVVAVAQGDLPSVRSRTVADVPATEDHLGFTAFVGALDGLLNDQQTTFPVTLGVTAPWGGGKSSVMRQLQIRLQHRSAGSGRSWYIVSFPAWKYETSTAIWAALAEKIYQDASSQMSYFERVWFRFQLESRRLGLGPFLMKSLAPFAAVVAAGLGASLSGLLNGPNGVAVISSGSIAALVGGIVAFWGVVGDPFKRAIASYAGKQKVGEVLGFTPSADKNVREFIQALTRRRHLAVFVDDLDRCNSRSVVSVIETINQVFNSDETSQAAFILGMDRAMITSGIEVAYRDSISYLADRKDTRALSFGENFLAKVVQVSVQVPKPDEEAMDELLGVVMRPPEEAPTQPGAGEPAGETGLATSLEPVASPKEAPTTEAPTGESDEPTAPASAASGPKMPPLDDVNYPDLVEPSSVEQVDMAERQMRQLDNELLLAASRVTEWMEPNPRLLKRFANAYRLQVYVATLTENDEVDLRQDQLIAFAKWVLMRLQWPALAASLDADTTGELLSDLEQKAVKQPSDRGASNGSTRTRRTVGSASWLEDARLKELLQIGGEEARISILPGAVLLRVD